MTQRTTSYWVNIDVDKAEDILLHQKLLAEAKDPYRRPAFVVRFLMNKEGMDVDGISDSYINQEEDARVNLSTREETLPESIYEIMFATVENPDNLKQLSRLLLVDIELHIREAHAFSTTDGYTIYFFLVSGWQDINALHKAIKEWISRNKKFEKGSWSGSTSQKLQPFMEETVGTSPRFNKAYASWTETPIVSSNSKQANRISLEEDCVSDIDRKLLQFGKKVASRSYGDMFHGTYFGEDVAINVLNSEKMNHDVWDDFKEDFNKLRKVDHANIIRLVASCTNPPCIITEWISGGNLFDFLHNENNVLDFPMFTKFSLDICQGMSLLHQKGIIHGDLKSANLIVDKDHVVKVANIGLTRFQDEEGDCTAETATYRWMAPEVINNQAYDTKADVYSFAVVLYELMTSKIPYDTMTPLQAAAAVIEGLRPQLPEDAHPGIANLIGKCWDAVPSARPSFEDIITELEDIQEHAQGTSTSWEAGQKPDFSQLLPNESLSGSEHATFTTAASENTTFFTAMTGSIGGDEPETQGLPRQ